ncbi:uncharacterized protein AMSG_00572 [Thecamonas trahens ATCC 50062]|uniref:Uncharacterized protein n=1 Tax=Thecamonas trahens ATCC 50062 TaxID=461836 RepID=A0A0L0D8T7_THETB|nr:hypothetical protein AMSG_00572 [Thecamonas trahens ATCC 50062]KNC48792.1 hypothetical protein AMSG_00572 [Thecamonas trahens ATCC 50062]|eukprot:XP_013762843.1 hypothetical protein AMSG_00572 [Thecamonas trahens ATCC 50062]
MPPARTGAPSNGTKILMPSVRPIDYINGTAEEKAAAIKAAGLPSDHPNFHRMYELTAYREAYSPPRHSRHGATQLMQENERESASQHAARNIEEGRKLAMGSLSRDAYLGLKQALQRGSLATPSAFAAMMQEDAAAAAVAPPAPPVAATPPPAQNHMETRRDLQYELQQQAAYEAAMAEQAAYEQAQQQAAYEQAAYEQAQHHQTAYEQAQVEAQYRTAETPAPDRARHAAETPGPATVYDSAHEAQAEYEHRHSPRAQQTAPAAPSSDGASDDFEYYFEDVVVADPQAELRAYQEEQKRKVLEFNKRMLEEKQAATARARMLELQEAENERRRDAAAAAAERARAAAEKQRQIEAAQAQLAQVEERQRREAQATYAEQMAERRRLEVLAQRDALTATYADNSDRRELAQTLQEQIAARRERELRQRAADAAVHYEGSLPLKPAYSTEAARSAQEKYRQELQAQIALTRERRMQDALRELQEDTQRARDVDARNSTANFDWNEHRAAVRAKLQAEWEANMAAKQDREMRERLADIQDARTAIERDVAAAAAEREAKIREQENSRKMVSVLQAQMANKRERELREALYDAQFAAPAITINAKGQYVQRVRRKRRKAPRQSNA